MNIAIIIIFALLGVVLITLEIFVLPGTSVAGIAGGLFAVASAWMAFAIFGPNVGWITVISIIVLTVISSYVFVKMDVMGKVSLKTKVEGKIEDKAKGLKVGDIGVASSRLAPIGNGEFGEIFVEVKSITGFIDSGKEIEVISVDNNEVLVKQKV